MITEGGRKYELGKEGTLLGISFPPRRHLRPPTFFFPCPPLEGTPLICNKAIFSSGPASTKLLAEGACTFHSKTFQEEDFFDAIESPLVAVKTHTHKIVLVSKAAVDRGMPIRSSAYTHSHNSDNIFARELKKFYPYVTYPVV